MKCWARKINLILAIIGLLIFGNIYASQAQRVTTQASGAYQVKAAFIYNFIQFINWPAAAFANTTAPIEIGIFGKDPFGAMIDETVEGVRVGGRLMMIRRSPKLEELQSCQIIFISRSEAKFLSRVLREIENRPILTISDIDQFAWKGGMIGFIVKQNKIRFQINLIAMRKPGLNISSKVLRLAEIIEGTVESDS